jgi:integrase
MPKRIVPLVDTQIRSEKPGVKDKKIFDGKGLFLLVATTGGKLWRFRYQLDGKDKTMALGTYPEITLEEARNLRDEARKLVAKNIDPAAVKRDAKREQKEKRAKTFEKLAREWHEHRSTELAPKTRANIMARLERDVFPAIGKTALEDLTPGLILQMVLLPIQRRGAVQVAHRVRSIVSMVLRYGVANQRCERDLTADLRGALKPIPKAHYAALDGADDTTDPAKVGALLRAIDSFDGSFIVKCAMRLHPFTALRPGPLRCAEWSEINFDTATWSIPAGKMKMKRSHIVPLSDQAVAILRELQPLTGAGRYVFPSTRTTAKPISDMTMNAAMRRLGYEKTEMTPHGWRAIFRTLSDEVLQERVEVIAMQLAHQVKDMHGESYNRTKFLKERRALLQRWANYLGSLKAGGNVIPIHKTA